jgi:hypothetical protein
MKRRSRPDRYEKGRFISPPPQGHTIQSNQTNEHKLAIIITHSINFAKEKFMN